MNPGKKELKQTTVGAISAPPLYMNDATVPLLGVVVKVLINAHLQVSRSKTEQLPT